MGCWGPRVDINEYFHPWHGSMFFHTLATPTLDMTITTGCLCLLLFFFFDSQKDGMGGKVPGIPFEQSRKPWLVGLYRRFFTTHYYAGIMILPMK